MGNRREDEAKTDEHAENPGDDEEAAFHRMRVFVRSLDEVRGKAFRQKERSLGIALTLTFSEFSEALVEQRSQFVMADL